MSGEIGRNREMTRRWVCRRAIAFLAITFAGFSTHVGSAQAPDFECAQLSNVPDDGSPLAVGLKVLASKKIDPSQAESACRSALRADPANPTFMFLLGRALSLGHGLEIPQDFANARHWYEKAAALGNAASMNNLADLYRYGRGVAPDLPAVANWYLKAAKLGLASAMNSLGELSEAGTGVPQNYQTAKNWYQKAADLGNADAMGNLGALFESGRGGRQLLEIAREWYVKGAALNGRVAMHNLGAMLVNGRGTSKNLVEAKFWYERAAALDYAPALNDLGRLYLAGAGVPKNYVRAKTSFEQAAKLGNAKAMNNLGMLYLNGTGVQRNINLARSWFERAIALNNAEAQENLKHLEEATLVDGAQVAARRASCMQICATLHRSYVNSVCGRYSAIADNGQPERTKCVRMSLTLAQPCRSSCREWAPTSLADNKCVTCFQVLIACSSGQEPPDSNDVPYAVPKDCLAALADCTANCRGQTGAKSGTPNASRVKLK